MTFITMLEYITALMVPICLILGAICYYQLKTFKLSVMFFIFSILETQLVIMIVLYKITNYLGIKF